MDCSFCGNELIKGSGKIFAKKDGTLYYFCSTKCERNMLELKRRPDKTRWTNLYQKTKKALKAKAEKGKEKRKPEEKIKEPKKEVKKEKKPEKKSKDKKEKAKPVKKEKKAEKKEVKKKEEKLKKSKK